MTDGTDRPHSPQPEPNDQNPGGYGYPQGQIPAGGGYGYPQAGQPGGYGYPQAPAGPGAFGPPPGGPAETPSGYGFPQAGPYQQGPGAPQPGDFQAQAPFPPSSDEPDWGALADGAARERRRKRLWAIGGAVTVLAVLAGGGAYLLLGGGGSGDDAKASESPSASPSPSVSGSKAAVDNTPTVADDPTKLRDRSGKSHLKMGPEAAVAPVDKRFEFRTTGTANSYAESEKALVDVSKSFTVTARVSNSAPKGRQIAVSQGNGKTFSFELGSDEVNGKPAWIFRIQTDAAGADATAKTVVAEGRKMDNTMTELTGTYNDTTKMITLFVDGKQINEAKVPAVYKAAGPLQLGRTRAQDAWAGAWSGAMDSVRIYRIALSPEQVNDQKPGKLDASIRPVASWMLY
ncbi:LamG domain-containing protein [Streptomyces sp. NPDC060048]|uniref:LamG domain-containing protein n=1 Tax=unclassified Streptomyces TaxID=2593676 RepID=UPI0036AA777A